LLAPLIGYLPMAGLAALLLLVAWNMAELKHFVHILRVAPRSDALVLVTCFVLTVVFDMVVAVSVGVVLAALLFMGRMAEITQAHLIGVGEGERADGNKIPADLGKKVAIYEIAGPLFFGAAQKAMASLGAVAGGLQVLIVRLEKVPIMDATGLVAFESAISTLTGHGCVTILVGLQEQPSKLVERAGLLRGRWRIEVCPDLASALAAARGLI
jgi:SulP family sulfate permease